MLLLNTGGSTGIAQQYADGYEWSLPTGWSFNGPSNSRIVNIYPDNNCRGGTVTVKAYMNCFSGKKYSAPSTAISINRVGFNSNLGIPSGYTGPKCGNTNPVTSTAANLSCATSYRWTATNTNWKDGSGALGPWTTSTNTITLHPSGTPSDEGIIAVDINIGCATVSQTYTAVYNPVPPNPSITKSSSLSEMCAGNAWTFTCTPPPGYSNTFGFDWYATNGLLVYGNATSITSPFNTNSNSVTISAPGSAFGNATVYVRLNNNFCTPSNYVHISTQVGPYSSSQFSVLGPTLVCPNSTQYYSSSFINQSMTNFQWGWSGVTSQTGQGTPYLSVYVPPSFNSGSITLRITNRCGTTGSPAIKVIYKAACYGGNSFMAYPVPASNTLTVTTQVNDDSTIEEATTDLFRNQSTSIALINMQAIVMKSVKMVGRSMELDVSDLPEGYYYLRIINNGQLFMEKIQISR